MATATRRTFSDEQKAAVIRAWRSAPTGMQLKTFLQEQGGIGQSAFLRWRNDSKLKRLATIGPQGSNGNGTSPGGVVARIRSKIRFTPEYQAALLAEYKTSGLTLREFATKKHIPLSRITAISARASRGEQQTKPLSVNAASPSAAEKRAPSRLDMALQENRELKEVVADLTLILRKMKAPPGVI